MKYSVRLLLYTHQPNAKGQYPIYIRTTINRKQSYQSTGHFIPEKYWDDKNEQVKAGYMLANEINADITTRKQTIIKEIVAHQLKGEVITPAKLKQPTAEAPVSHNIFNFCETFIKEVKHKRRPGTLENYRKHLKVLELYHGSRSLTFEEITHAYLVKFEDHLRNSVGNNYIHVIWKTIKTFFNAANKRGVINYYPFNVYENPVYEAPIKDYLTLAEMDKVEAIADTTKDPVVRQTTIYFLLGCYSGLRLSDWRQFNYDEHVKDGRLYLRAKKNDEWVTMPVVGRLARHLERVKTCALKISEQEMNRTLKGIAGIKKKLTTHSGRHSFAITMCAEQGISSETCSELMGITVATCINSYYRVTNRKIDGECLKAWK